MEIADATKTKDFLDKISEDPSILFTDAAGSKKTLLNVLQATFSSCKFTISGTQLTKRAIHFFRLESKGQWKQAQPA